MAGTTQVLPPSEIAVQKPKVFIKDDQIRIEFPEKRCTECGRPIHFDEVECPFCDNDVINLGY